MAITTYAELQTAVTNWLNRSNLSARVPEFISMAEATIGRRLRTQDMLSIDTGTISEGMDLPSDFRRVKSFYVTVGGNNVELKYMAPAELFGTYGASGTGTPTHYSIMNSDIYFGRQTDSAYAYQMVYYASLAALSDSNTSNWLLTKHPDVYLFGALTMAEPYVKNDPRFALWKQQFEQAIEEINLEDIQDRPGGRTARVRQMGTP